MGEQLKQFYKKVFKGSPFLPGAIICFLIAGIIFFTGNNQPQVKGVATRVTATINPTSIPTATLEPTETVTNMPQRKGPTSAPVPTTKPTSSTTQQSQTPNTSGNPQPTNTPAQAQNLSVNLSINGSSAGQVSVPTGSNICDVLSAARDQGKISSLNMRYDNSLGTYGVYQINGVGKENSIWWTYSVNGSEPGQGCSYIKAVNDDNINWKYVGS